MDKQLKILEHLYGDRADPAALATLLEDDALRAEYAAMQATKAALDQRPKARPAPALIDQIVAAAGPVGAAPTRQPRPDRPASRRRPAMGLVYRALQTAAVVALLGVLLWRWLPAPLATAPADLASEAAESLAEAPRQQTMPPAVQQDAPALEESQPAAPARREAIPPRDEISVDARSTFSVQDNAVGNQMADVAAPSPVEAPPLRFSLGTTARAGQVTPPVVAFEARTTPAEDAALLDWDEADDVRRLHWRIAALQDAQDDLQWGEPVGAFQLTPASAVPPRH